MPEITIITTTYNRAELLPRTIECVLNQTFSDFEYIIINNGSTDGRTHDLINKYIQLDKRISCYSYSENMLITDQNWFATLLHKGCLGDPKCDYTLIIDDDDIMESDTLENLYHMALETQSEIVGFGSRYLYEDGSLKDKYVFDGIFTFNRVEGMRELLQRKYFNSARGGKLYKKKVLHFDLVPGVRNRDIYREYRVMNNINQITICGEPKYYFYRHGKNLSGLDCVENITPEKMQEHLQANHIRTKWLSENMPEIIDYVFYSEASFMISLWNRIHSLEVKSCYQIAEFMRKWILAHKELLKKYNWYTNCEVDTLNKMNINWRE